MIALFVALAIAGWAPMPAHGLEAVYHGPRGELLAVTRTEAPNPDAWRPKTRDAYLDEIEAGALARGGSSARRASHARGEVLGVPVLDLEIARGGTTIVVRYLVFRTYTLSCAIEIPAGGNLAAARALAQSLVPSERAS